MIPISIRLCGFMSYREEQELRFDEDGLWVLEGPNGVGKSTIFDAITFVLFGEHRRGRQHHEDLINHNSDSMKVELVLRMEDASYKFLRCHPKAKKGKPVWQIFTVSAGGESAAIPGTEQREGYNAWVREHIGMDYEAFTMSILLLQGESDKLLRQKPEERRKLLAQLIDLSRYERLHARAKRHEDDHHRDAVNLERRLNGMADVKEEDVAAAMEALSLAEEERRACEREADDLNRLVPLAKQREALIDRRDTLTRRLGEERELLAQAPEIRAKVAELDRLEPILPDLRDVTRDRQALTKVIAKARHEEAAANAAEAEAHAAESKMAAARSKQEELQERLDTLNASFEDLSTERDRLRPLQERWSAAERLRQQQEKRAAEIAALDGPEKEETKAALSSAQSALEERRDEAARATAEIKSTTKRLKDLDKLTADSREDKVVCSLCGQPIKAEHAARERSKLKRELRQQESACAAAKDGVDAAEKKVEQIEKAHEGAVKNGERRRVLMEEQQRAQEEIERQAKGITRAEALAAGQRLKELSPLLEKKRQELMDHQGALKEARDESAAAMDRWKRADERRRALAPGLHAALAEQRTIEGRLDAMTRKLPEDLREASPDQVAHMEGRVTALLPYRDRAARLKVAESSDAKRGIEEVERQLDQIPEAARRPVQELDKEVEAKTAARENAQKIRDARVMALDRLRREQRERFDVLEKHRASKREERLYGLLTKLLGPDELQRHLVRDSERAIVDLANHELLGLTHGSLQLSLRSGKDGEDSAQKALELDVLNQETGETPTALDLASGSQKFRVSLSLALAIGRYLARETKRVESVIIDEGFGCLDRAGREDAIAVLKELSSYLPRVILVSHQEEFAGRFKSGYKIDLIDRTSVPTRVSR